MTTRSPITRTGEPPFLVLTMVMLAAFLIPRLPFFWYYPRAELSLDSQTYLDVAAVMKSGQWPHFIYRTPGYPLLIWAVTSVVDRWLAVIYVQNLLSFASALCLVGAVRRFRPSLAIPATLAMCGFLGSSQVMIYDISLLSDSLYTSTVILLVALTLMAFSGNGPGWFAGASGLMGITILIRPAGSYLAVIYILTVGYLLWNRAGPRAVAGFAIPFPAILLCFCAYNRATIGQFTVSPFTEANLAGATALFWEPDPRMSAVANKALEGIQASYDQNGITHEDLEMVRHSWDTGPLFDIYDKAYNRLVWSARWGDGSRFGSGDYMQNRKYIKEVSEMAIRRHPVLYFKYVWVNLVAFFEGIGYKFDVEASLKYRESQRHPGAAAAPAPPPAADERAVEGLQRGWQAVHGWIFQNILWTFAYFAMLLASTVQLLRHRGRHLGAFILLFLTLIPIGAALVVCLVEVALDRYSYATQFVDYLSVALSPLLLMASRPAAGGGAAR